MIFAAAEITPTLEARLTIEGFQSVRLSVIAGTKEDAAKTGEIAKSQNASWVVADSYNFGIDYQRAIKAGGLRLLLVDDYGHAGEYVADFVLNQNLTADAALYARRASHTRLLLGTRYALLREEFQRWHDWKREIPAVARKVLVTLGGADPDNVTGKVIQSLAGFGNIETVVVVGGSNPHLEKLKAEVRNSKSEMRLVVEATSMPELMAWADLAVTAGGSTCWETCLLGLPACVLIIADNQANSVQRLHDSDAALSLGRNADVSPDSLSGSVGRLLLDAPSRRALSECARSLVDGRGAERVATAIRGETGAI